jgi:outer membrane protein OmpA-like peptidoglycan-associated protein
MSDHDEPSGPGVPPWLISFGDMMTLFLCFFIILVTMAPKPESGFVAAGLGEFVSVLGGTGVGGALDGEIRLRKVNEFRERFGLVPLTLEEYLSGQAETKSAPELEKMVQDSLKDYRELMQPAMASFEPGSSELTQATRGYLDRMAKILRPASKQLLVLEGWSGKDARLGAARAAAVRKYVAEEHRFITVRVEARGGVRANDPDELHESSRTVDFRLVDHAPPTTDP